MKKKYIFIIVAILLFIVCFFYFNNEKIYLSKEYNSTGNLISTNEFVYRNGNPVLHGKFINYNDKGVKIAEGQFIDGHINGECIYYLENGKMKTLQFKKNKITLESTNFSQNGLIEKYIMCDDFGKSVFTIYFDEKGATHYDGHFQIETYQYKFSHKKQFNITEDQKLKIGDTLKYSYIVANIPNAKRSFTIENVGIDNSKVNRITKKIEPCQIDVKEVLTKKGKNTVRSIVKYEFNDKVTPVFTDTLSFDIDVN